MTTTRKQFGVKFKAEVAVEAICGEWTLSQLASQYRVRPVQIGQSRRAALEQMAELFVDGRSRKQADHDAEKTPCTSRSLKVELDRLRKKLVCSTEEGAYWWSRIMLRSACGGNASCWA
jgi:transposase